MTHRKGPPRQPIPGDGSDPQGLTALLQHYLVWLETHNFSAQTANVRRLQLSRFIAWCLDRAVTRPEQLSPAMLERFQRHLFHYRQADGRQLCISSQCHWLTSLRGWMAWIQRQGLISENPARNLQLPKSEKRLPRHPLSTEEVETLLQLPDISTPCGLRMRALLELLYSTGLRRREALQLYRTDNAGKSQIPNPKFHTSTKFE